MRRCGRKFGEILDVVWMQQILKCDVPHAFDNQTEKTGPGQRKKAIQEYRGRGLDARIARSAAEVEGTYYGKLTRVEEIRWRTYLEGSQGKPEREFNGPVKGLKQIYEEGLDALEAAAQSANNTGFYLLALADRQALMVSMDPDFQQTVYAHTVEGMYGDPVYGGNFNQLGWKLIDYEGDRQPIGYSAHQMAFPEEG